MRKLEIRAGKEPTQSHTVTLAESGQDEDKQGALAQNLRRHWLSRSLEPRVGTWEVPLLPHPSPGPESQLALASRSGCL